MSNEKEKAVVVTGRAKGGVARREKLSPERRREIAITAARARHGILVKATHKGNFKDEFGINVDCYVLDDAQKTAVISQSGMGQVLGLTVRGNAFPRFIGSKTMEPHVGAELREKLEKTLKFQWGSGGAEQPPSDVYGYDVTTLIDVCDAIVDADNKGDLSARHQNVVKQARTIRKASAKQGIKNLVYALAGYDATRQEVIDSFKFYVRETARDYEKEFPDELYEQWYRLYDLPRPDKNRPWKFMHLTINHVYAPLARSNGKILELTRAMRDSSGQRHKKLHQFLEEIGVKALRRHLGRLLGIAETSDSKTSYEGHVEKIFGQQLTLDFGQPI